MPLSLNLQSLRLARSYLLAGSKLTSRVKPEQPPPFTANLIAEFASICFSVKSFCIFLAAVSVKYIIKSFYHLCYNSLYGSKNTGNVCRESPAALLLGGSNESEQTAYAYRDTPGHVYSPC